MGIVVVDDLGEGTLVIGLSSYELVWPADLFVAEATRFVSPGRRGWSTRAEWLLAEAFQGSSACLDFENLHAAAPKAEEPWGHAGCSLWERLPALTHRTWLRELIDRAKEIRRFTQPRPYRPHRQGMTSPRAPPCPDSVRLGALLEADHGQVHGDFSDCLPGDVNRLQGAVRQVPDDQLVGPAVVYEFGGVQHVHRRVVRGGRIHQVTTLNVGLRT
ncbi:hypothetical protein ABZW30_21585 [Kitasatospora sp. NPDC004669]|uniref:hypothetical protein n=1 Tax=Kitasatospora sp. NPDC004669 TaxID=3154555 RepID=UPI0033A925A1